MAKTIRIGHASTDSASSSANEVLIGTYYASLAPTVVLRPKTLALAEKSAAACEAGCNNNYIEYSQSSRNTLNTEAEKVDYNLGSITTRCYADCSSFMTVCAIAGGSKLKYSSGAPNCGNMKTRFTQSGDYIALTDKIYLTSSDYLQRGDILVRETYLDGSRHTVMVLDNGSKVPSTGYQDDAPQVDLAQAAFTAVKVALSIIEINVDKVTIKARLTKIKNGKETSLSSSAIKSYKWSYLLESLDTQKTSAKTLQVSSASHEFTITGLASNSSYRVKVTAVEEDSDAEFGSPNVMFMTQTKATADNKKADLGDTSASIKKCKIFVKTEEALNPAILYNKEV